MGKLAAISQAHRQQLSLLETERAGLIAAKTKPMEFKPKAKADGRKKALRARQQELASEIKRLQERNRSLHAQALAGAVKADDDHRKQVLRVEVKE